MSGPPDDAGAPDRRPRPHPAAIERPRLLVPPAAGTVVVGRGLPLGGRSTWLDQLVASWAPPRPVDVRGAGRLVVARWPLPLAERTLTPADLQGTGALDGALVGFDPRSDVRGRVLDPLHDVVASLVERGAALAVTASDDAGWLPRRWRLEARVRVVGPEELAFTPPELAAALASHGIVLDDDLLQAIHARSAGWTGVIGPVRAAVGGGTEPAPPDAHLRVAARLLAEEIVEQLAPGERSHVLPLAVAEVVPRELLVELADDQAPATLAALASSTAWLSTPNAGAAWSVHPLVREGLEDIARDAHDVDLGAMRRRVAQWAADQGDDVGSAEALIAARAWPEALDLIRAWPSEVDSVGEGKPARRLLEQVPYELWRGDEVLVGRFAADALLSGDAGRALKEIDALVASREATALAPLLRDDVLALTVLWSTPPATARAAAARIRRAAEQTTELTTEEALRLRAHAEVLTALSDTLLYERTRAAERLGALLDATPLATPIALAAHGTTSWLHALLGDLRAAGDAARRAGELLPARTRLELVLASIGTAADAEAAQLQGRSAQALAIAGEALDRARQVRAATLHALAAAPSAHALLQRGDPTAALAMAAEPDGPLHGSAALRLAALRARALVRLKLPHDAARTLREIPLGPDTVLAHAEVAKATDDRATLDAVERWRPPPWATARLAAALARVTAQADKSRAASLAARSEAARTAEQLGIVGPLLELGAQVRRDVLATAGGDLVELVARAQADATSSAPEGERPSTRELELLRLLPLDLTQREAAELLGVSPNTVKTHTRNLYRKLEVTTREAAVAEARRRGWL